MEYDILINKKNPIKEDFIDSIDLDITKDVYNNDIKVEKVTFEQFIKLRDFLEGEGIIIGIDNSFRSFSEQKEIYDDFVLKYGKDYANKYVAPIGTSEHHSGLCIDISLIENGKIVFTNEELLKRIQVFDKIKEVLNNYGFIVRYPEGKEKITGYSYEPWHIRYVGISIAKYLEKKNYTLEEYYIEKNSGILVVNKEKGMTSRDVVNIVSKKLGIKKIGHTGTLDPLATGVLVLTIGRATKIGELLTSTYKEYTATVKMGVETDTLDITGNVLKEEKIDKNLEIEKVVATFQKKYYQEVPIYSAVKVKGKKLYQYARNEEKVILPKKEVIIKEIKLLEKNKDTFKFKCLVSKGTYIRSLIKDIALKLEISATMSELIRTKQGNFTIENSYTIEDIRNNNYKIIPIKEVLQDIKQIIVNKNIAFKISNGVVLENIYNVENIVLFLNEEKEILAIYKNCDNLLKPWKMF